MLEQLVFGCWGHSERLGHIYDGCFDGCFGGCFDVVVVVGFRLQMPLGLQDQLMVRSQPEHHSLEQKETER